MTTADQTSEAVGSCWECGYALRGLESRRCPECGRPFDPDDPATMNMGREVGWLAAWLMRPPGWAMYLLLGGAVLVSLWACVVPTRRGAFSDIVSGLLLVPPRLWWRRIGGFWLDLDSPYGRFLLGAALWMPLIMSWAARRVTRGIVVRRVSNQKAAPFAYWRRWLVVPVVFGLTILVGMTRLPTYAGFWVSKPWLERAAREAKASPARYLSPGVLGAFGRYPLGSGKGKQWAQVVDENGRTQVLIGYEAALVRQEDGEPPAGRMWAAEPPWRIRRLSSRWFLVEPDRASH
jgi:hypothetical protein